MIRTVPILAIAMFLDVAHADDTRSEVRAAAESKGDLDLRLTLSSFLFRQAGDDGGALVSDGAPVENASPVRRYFGDLRIEMAESRLQFDGRVRQTTGERYQSGADGSGEYEVRRLAYKIGSERRGLIVGRQYVEAVGSTKIDGVAFVQRLSKIWSGTMFGGAYPALGSRSLDTDYPAIQKADGSSGSPLFPLSGGLGIGYNTPSVHGDVGVAAVYVAQDIPDATSSEVSRVFTTASGYARPTRWLDVYHFMLLDVAGGAGVNLTNGSLGINAHATTDLQLTVAVNHVSTDLLQIAARNVLEDPDPNAAGIVQNNVAIIRVSQDTVRAGASLALAKSRFEISLSGGYHRRPGVEVALGDGGTVRFPNARSVDSTLTVLDRKSIGNLRASASATLTLPLEDTAPNRSRSAVVRFAAGRPWLDDRFEITADLMLARFRNTTDAGACMDSLDVFTCFSSSKTSAIETGALASYRIGREWLLLLDSHVGLHDVEATSITGTIDYPRVLSLTVFARAQWRYR